jgi:hypothetical protein
MLIGFTSFSAQQYPTAVAFHSYEDGSGALRLEGTSKQVKPTSSSTMWHQPLGRLECHRGRSTQRHGPRTIQEYAASRLWPKSLGTWWGQCRRPLIWHCQTDSPDPLAAGANVTYSISLTTCSSPRYRCALCRYPPRRHLHLRLLVPRSLRSHQRHRHFTFGDRPERHRHHEHRRQLTKRHCHQYRDRFNFGPDTNPANNTAKILTTVNPRPT